MGVGTMTIVLEEVVCERNTEFGPQGKNHVEE